MNTCAFLLTSLIIILIPGTGVIYTVSVGMSEGRGKSVFAALGCTAGILLHCCLAGTAKEWLCRSPRRMSLLQKCFGITFLAFAIQLAL